MGWKRAVTGVAVTGLAVISVWAGQEAARPAGGSVTPVLRVENSRVELGNVAAGEDAVAVFTLHNDGELPVRILKAKPS